MNVDLNVMVTVLCTSLYPTNLEYISVELLVQSLPVVSIQNQIDMTVIDVALVRNLLLLNPNCVVMWNKDLYSGNDLQTRGVDTSNRRIIHDALNSWRHNATLLN